MYNPETLATDTERRQTKQNQTLNTLKMNNADPTKNTGG